MRVTIRNQLAFNWICFCFCKVINIDDHKKFQSIENKEETKRSRKKKHLKIVLCLFCTCLCNFSCDSNANALQEFIVATGCRFFFRGAKKKCSYKDFDLRFLYRLLSYLWVLKRRKKKKKLITVDTNINCAFVQC